MMQTFEYYVEFIIFLTLDPTIKAIRDETIKL